MKIESVKQPSCTIVHVAGHLDRATAPQLELALQEIIEDGQQCIVVDLSEVPEMSSAGLRVLITAVKNVRAVRPPGDLRLAAPSARVMEVLDLAGLLTVLRTFDSAADAAASFHHQVPDRQKPRLSVRK